MYVYRVILRFLATVVLAAPLLATTACGGSKQDSVLRANVKPGDMPEGGEWTGVYYSTSEGYLHLIKDGSSVNAKWRTVAGDEWGELHGEVTGDLLRFEWKSHRIGAVGPGAQRSGKGYFKYTKGKEEGAQDEIHGEYGLGVNEAGTSWKAIKQANMIPEPNSVLPDEVEDPGTSGGGWDEGEGGGDDEEGGDDEGGEDEGGGDDEAPPDPPIH